jgi:hypothetical protein
MGLLIVAAALLSGCYERKQTTVLNPDGSGKMVIETDVAVPTIETPGKQKPSAVSFGREIAAQFINSTRGVDAWSEVSVTEAADGRAHIRAVAYFPDISAVRTDLPLTFSWQRQEGGICQLTVARTRNNAGAPVSMSDEQLKEQVQKAQAQYKEQQLALQTALNAFNLQLTFVLPGEVTGDRVFTRKDNTVSLTLDGKKIAAALDKFMADDAALARTIKSGQDLTDNDDILLDAMYGKKGPVSATVKLPPDASPVFDYRAEARAAAAAQHAMLEAAGVQLVPRFIVKPPAGAADTEPGAR